MPEPAGVTPDELLELTRDRLRERTVDLLRSDQALREQTRILRSVMDSMAEGVVVVDLHGRFLLYNPAATRILGAENLPLLLVNPASERSPISRPLLGTWTADGTTPFLQEELPLVRALDGRQVTEEDILFRTSRAPEGVWLRVNARPLDDDSGARIGALVVLRDITDRRRAELELARRREDLERSNAELERFAHAVSHDLKEPLRVVSGFAQLLQRRYQGRLDADADEFIGSIVQGVQRAWRLIDDLLEYSRVGTRGGELAQTESAAALDLALANLQAAVEESGARITRGALPTVFADASQLARIFQNLVGNAIKFRGDAAPNVHVEGRRQGDQVVFAVRDNGIGIDARHHDRIFVIFQRLHTRGTYQGTGVGLAICKRIVERHGGRIWVESAPDQGATFRFTLPATRPRS